jgi:hypothetical protein
MTADVIKTLKKEINALHKDYLKHVKNDKEFNEETERLE